MKKLSIVVMIVISSFLIFKPVFAQMTDFAFNKTKKYLLVSEHYLYEAQKATNKDDPIMALYYKKLSSISYSEYKKSFDQLEINYATKQLMQDNMKIFEKAYETLEIRIVGIIMLFMDDLYNELYKKITVELNKPAGDYKLLIYNSLFFSSKACYFKKLKDNNYSEALLYIKLMDLALFELKSLYNQAHLSEQDRQQAQKLVFSMRSEVYKSEDNLNKILKLEFTNKFKEFDQSIQTRSVKAAFVD